MAMQKPSPAVRELTGDNPRLPRFQQRCIAVISDRTVSPDFVKMLTMQMDRVGPSSRVHKTNRHRRISLNSHKGLAGQA